MKTPVQLRQLLQILKQDGKWEHQPTLLKYRDKNSSHFNNSKNNQTLKVIANFSKSSGTRYPNVSSALTWIYDDEQTT